MPKFKCVCGNTINLSTGTSEAELSLVSEVNILQIAELLAEKTELTDENFFNLIDQSKRTVYECPVCKRLHVEEKSGSGIFNSYKPEIG